jgi:hypothetical protein
MEILNVSALSNIGFYSPIYTSIKSMTQHWVEQSRLISPDTDSMMYSKTPLMTLQSYLLILASFRDYFPTSDNIQAC